MSFLAPDSRARACDCKFIAPSASLDFLVLHVDQVFYGFSFPDVESSPCLSEFPVVGRPRLSASHYRRARSAGNHSIWSAFLKVSGGGSFYSVDPHLLRHRSRGWVPCAAVCNRLHPPEYIVLYTHRKPELCSSDLGPLLYSLRVGL